MPIRPGVAASQAERSPMTDSLQNHSDTAMAPSRAPFAIIPNDSAELPAIPKGIYVGTGGHVTLRGVGANADVTYRNLPDASYIAVRAQYVRATGTSASDLIGEA